MIYRKTSSLSRSFVFSMVLSLCLVTPSANSLLAVTGAPTIINHQGRLLDSSGNVLGGTSGTNYCFRFSFYDDATVGGGDTQLWPAGTPSKMTSLVKNGIFSVGIGDTVAGGDTLDFDFQSTDEAYLNVEVANSISGSCAAVSSFETLSPRPRVTSAGYAINANNVGGFTPAQSATGSQIPVLTGGALILGSATPAISATGVNGLTLQSGATGDINFFSALNKITSSGNLTIAGTLSSAGLALTLGSDATGDLYYRGAGGAFTRLGVGSNGQALIVSGGLPSWQAIPGGGDMLKATYDAGDDGIIDVAAGGTGATSFANLFALGTDTTGNYVATIADAGSGRITVTGSGSETAGVTLDIADDAVTFAKIQNITDARLIGRSAGSSGDAQEITVGTGLSLSGGALTSTITQYTDENAQDAVGTILPSEFTYNDAGNAITLDSLAWSKITGTPTTIAGYGITNGLTTSLANGSILVGNGSGVATAVTPSGDVTISNTGVTAIGANTVALGTDTTGNYVATIADAGSGRITVTGSGSETAGVTLDIADDAVTFAKIQNITDARLIGRSAGSSGDAQEITVGTGLSLSGGALTSTITQYTDELAQDAVGTILPGEFTYNDGGNAITLDSLAWSKITGTPTTIAGYGITNGLTTSLANGSILVGNGSGVATAVTPSGDVTISNTGVTTIGANTVALTTDTTGNYVAGATANEGLTLTGTEGGTLGIALTSSGTTGSTSSNSGLEVGSAGLTLLKGCTDNEILKYTDAGGWACATDSTGSLTDADYGDITVSGSGATWTIDADSVALGTDTTGNYVATIADAGSGRITVTGSGSEGAGVTLDIANLAVDTAQLAANAVTAAKIADDVIDWADIADATTLDTSTSIGFGAGSNSLTFTNNGTGNMIIDLTSTGDFVINDNGTAALTVNDSGNLVMGTGYGMIASNIGIEFTESDTNPSCASGDYKIYADTSEAKLKKCVNGVVSDIQQIPDLNSFTDSTLTATWTDADTNELWDDATRPNITPRSTASEILVMVTVHGTVASSGGGDTNNPVARVDRETGVTADCADTNTVGGLLGDLYLEAGATETFSISSIFVDTPATTSNVSYTVCSSASSAGLSDTTRGTRTEVTLFEVNDAADLAEVYPTNDSSIGMGDVVSLDPTLEAGVRKSSGAYDRNVLGIVSTKPALVIGGTGDAGVKGVPVALSGRVPVKVSAENGVINPGDLLTASSIPGVAMKATKAGQVLGQAMSGYTGSGVGEVLVFVKTMYGTGDHVAVGTQGKETLAYLVAEKPAHGAPFNASDVVADRVIAGLEVVTPLVVADTVDTKKIIFAGGDGSSVEVTGETITSLADLVKSLDEERSATSLALTGISTDLGAYKARLEVLEGLAFSEAGTEAPTLENLTLGGTTTFSLPPVFNNNTAGFALIKQGQTKAEVSFTQEYMSTPVVSASLSFAEADVMTDEALQNLFTADLQHVIVGTSPRGFTIVLSKPAPRDMRFSWIALAVHDVKIFESIPGLVVEAPQGSEEVPVVEPEPVSVEEVVSIEETPAVEEVVEVQSESVPVEEVVAEPVEVEVLAEAPAPIAEVPEAPASEVITE